MSTGQVWGLFVLLKDAIKEKSSLHQLRKTQA